MRRLRETKADAEGSVGVAYVESALRLLAREWKQRERVAFTASAGVALPGDVDSSSRKLANRLDRVDSQRARARRRRSEARMRRALLSGKLSAGEVAQRLANVSLVEVSAADHLIELIESTESRLSKELCGEVAGGVSALYAWCSAGLSRKRQARAANKAVRFALGMRMEEGVEEVGSSPPRKRIKKTQL